MKNVLVSALTAALIGVCFYAPRWVEASRNSAGTFALSTPGVPFQSSQVISSTQVNNTFTDIASTLTDSLDRGGKGGMLASLRGIDGTVAAPAFSWTSETGSGLFRNGASDVRMSIAGSLREQWSSTGVAITGTLGATGTTSLATGGTKWIADGTTIASNSALYSGSVTPGASNYILAADGFSTTTALNGPTGGKIELNINGANVAKVNGSGVTVGASGTAISQSNRGTASLTPGSLSAQTCANQTVTVTGAAAGAECAPGLPSAGMGAFSAYCFISATNTCTITICNPTAGALTPASGTYGCRAFNP